MRTPLTFVALGALALGCEKDTTSKDQTAPSASTSAASPSPSPTAAQPPPPKPVQPPAPTGPKPGDLPAPPDVAAPPTDAQKTPSGLASKVLKKGTGKVNPKPTDRVKVHYTGWTTDGGMFDSSRKRGKPATFPLNAVIKGWTEGVALMVVGEERRFWIPVELAYQNRPGKPAGMLVFDVELLQIKQPPNPQPAPPAPPDVASIPGNAKKEKSGLASRVLKKGTGTTRPGPTETVEVHYTGWTTDGKMFDSSVVRGETIEFPLNGVIPGWTEGVGLMVEGEKRRLWIPEELAYKGQPGAPAGMLVFDVELISIVK